jgi:protein-tyrosine phosphatase
MLYAKLRIGFPCASLFFCCRQHYRLRSRFKGVFVFMHAVLFVCLGNICRSPLAEAAFRQVVDASRLEVFVDSAGTGDWHIGHPPDHRAQAVAAAEGVDISRYQARQVDRTDFMRFSHIIALDQSNLHDLHLMRPEDATAKLSLLLDHVPGRIGQSVADPYYGDARDFEVTWADVMAGAEGLALALQSVSKG